MDSDMHAYACIAGTKLRFRATLSEFQSARLGRLPPKLRLHIRNIYLEKPRCANRQRNRVSILF
jgi:hypothetical protein